MKLTDLKRDRRTNLEMEIDRLIEIMSYQEANSENYATMAANLEVLMKAKANEKARRISPDTLAIIAGNLLGIGLILSHERLNVISTKALGFVLKGRV